MRETSRFLLFPFSTGITVCLLLAIMLWMGFSLFSSSHAHHQEYQALVAATDSARNQKKANPYTATQQHRHTRKDLFFVKNGQRLQMKMISDDTELVLDHHEGTIEIVEKMRDVVCVMQEELYYILPDGREVVVLQNGSISLRDTHDEEILVDISQAVPMQIFRHLKTDEAKYYYQSEKFVSQKTQISRFLVKGHQLVENVTGVNPLMTGSANSVEVLLAGENSEFTAQNFKATLSEGKR